MARKNQWNNNVPSERRLGRLHRYVHQLQERLGVYRFFNEDSRGTPICMHNNYQTSNSSERSHWSCRKKDKRKKEKQETEEEEEERT